MSFLRTLTTNESVRQELRDDGVLDVFLPFVDLLGSLTELELRRGFRAGSVIARLAGNDETGIGPQILQGNPNLIRGTTEILDRVLTAGAKRTVINMLINPHFITMDLLIIATSDANKPLLRGTIPILLRALRLRGDSNELLTKDIVKIFLQLTYDPDCLSDLKMKAGGICSELKRILVPEKFDGETLLAFDLLQQTLLASPSLALDLTPTKEGMVSNLIEGRKPLHSVDNSIKHIMLSYTGNVKHLVKDVADLLSEQGYKVWFKDPIDVGVNSLFEVIDKSSSLIVLATVAYKNNAISRKICEIADDHKIPIYYAIAEENYKSNGWLGTRISNSPWFPFWSDLVLKDNFPALLERIKQDSLVASTPSRKLKLSTQERRARDSESLALLKALMSQLQEVRVAVEELTKKVDMLEANRNQQNGQ